MSRYSHLRHEHMPRRRNLSGFVLLPRIPHLSRKRDLSRQPDMLHTDIGWLADLSGNFNLLRLHADLRHHRPDMHGLADLYRYGDL